MDYETALTDLLEAKGLREARYVHDGEITALDAVLLGVELERYVVLGFDNVDNAYWLETYDNMQSAGKAVAQCATARGSIVADVYDLKVGRALAIRVTAEFL